MTPKGAIQTPSNEIGTKVVSFLLIISPTQLITNEESTQCIKLAEFVLDMTQQTHAGRRMAAGDNNNLLEF